MSLEEKPALGFVAEAKRLRRRSTSLARDVDGGVRLAVRVKPKSSNEGVAVVEGVVVVKVSAPPQDGQANARVVEFVAAFFALPRRQVEIVRGHAARDKDLLLSGVSAAAVEARLGI